ncbi:hypothetical protein ACFLU4_00045 [Chloroflexota bacterium]
MASRQISLSVNDEPIKTDYFVAMFIDHVVGGIVASLKGTGEIESADISIEGDTSQIVLNSVVVPTSPFVNLIVKSTVSGMVSSLKGVDQINKINISIKR